MAQSFFIGGDLWCGWVCRWLLWRRGFIFSKLFGMAACCVRSDETSHFTFGGRHDRFRDLTGKSRAQSRFGDFMIDFLEELATLLLNEWGIASGTPLRALRGTATSSLWHPSLRGKCVCVALCRSETGERVILCCEQGLCHITCIWSRVSVLQSEASCKRVSSKCLTSKSIIKSFPPQECPTRVPYRQECPTRVSQRVFRQECPMRVSHRVSYKRL